MVVSDKNFSSGESNQTDVLLQEDFGLSRDLIKQLPVKSLPDVALKAKLLREYMLAKRAQAEIMLYHGKTANMLLNQLADLNVLQSQRELLIKEGKLQRFDSDGNVIGVITDPLEDAVYMKNHDRITGLLVELHKLGIDQAKLDVERHKAGLLAEGTAFVVAKNDDVVVSGEVSGGAESSDSEHDSQLGVPEMPAKASGNEELDSERQEHG